MTGVKILADHLLAVAIKRTLDFVKSCFFNIAFVFLPSRQQYIFGVKFKKLFDLILKMIV